MTYNQLMLFVVEDCAHRCELPPLLVEAIIRVESDGNVNAWRPVPVRHVTLTTNDSEWMGRHCRWGPMLLPGVVARERGFDGPFPALCSMDLGVYWGCRQLKWLNEHYGGRHGWQGVIAAWNLQNDCHGIPADNGYVRQVINTMSQLATPDDGQQGAMREYARAG